MKFMKLGSKSDLFKDKPNSTRYVDCELRQDLVVNVGDVRFYLHKFPLLSKSQRIRQLLREENGEELRLYDFPGGSSAFEICAKFCYGMTVTLNAHNVVAVRCAAEYLEMREDVDRGNLIHKIEVFLNSSIFQSWKDSILCLQSAKTLLPWSEELNIVSRCVDSIASKISLDPRAVHWSYTHRKITDQGPRLRDHRAPVDWWVEDAAELDVDHFEMVIVAAEDVDGEDVISGLKAYAERWLPKSAEELVSEEYLARTKSIARRLLKLAASRGCASCGFLLTLLKIVVLIGEDGMKEELLTAISLQLDRASVRDLLIPSRSPCCSAYDLDIVLDLLKRFMERYVGSRDSEHGPPPQIVNILDGFLAEVASDGSLPLSIFLEFAEAVLGLNRASHDGLYSAVDVYLKAHPALTKAEKKRLCGIVDVKKLSTGVCALAAQNERLPLRLIVQVLFFEQVKAAEVAAAAAVSGSGEELLRAKSLSGAKIEEGRKETERVAESYTATQLKGLLLAHKGDYFVATERASQSSERSVDSLGQDSRLRRIFDRLWGRKTGKKGSERCGSPVSSFASVIPGRGRLPRPPLKPGRHSIS
ncbi:phototropic-responsive NPH3 family protein NPY4-like [Wolffia australiana]